MAMTTSDDFVTRKEWYQWVRLLEAGERVERRKMLEFMEKERRRRSLDRSPPKPASRREESKELDIESPAYADHVYGLGEIGTTSDVSIAKSRLNPERFPGISMNPDESPELIQTSIGRLMLGPRKDKDESERSLADSYGG